MFQVEEDLYLDLDCPASLQSNPKPKTKFQGKDFKSSKEPFAPLRRQAKREKESSISSPKARNESGKSAAKNSCEPKVNGKQRTKSVVEDISNLAQRTNETTSRTSPGKETAARTRATTVGVVNSEEKPSLISSREKSFDRKQTIGDTEAKLKLRRMEIQKRMKELR